MISEPGDVDIRRLRSGGCAMYAETIGFLLAADALQQPETTWRSREIPAV